MKVLHVVTCVRGCVPRGIAHGVGRWRGSECVLTIKKPLLRLLLPGRLCAEYRVVYGFPAHGGTWARACLVMGILRLRRGDGGCFLS